MLSRKMHDSDCGWGFEMSDNVSLISLRYNISFSVSLCNLDVVVPIC